MRVSLVVATLLKLERYFALECGRYMLVSQSLIVIHVRYRRDVDLVKGVKFEIIFPSGKVDAGKFFSTSAVRLVWALGAVHDAGHRAPLLDVCSVRSRMYNTLLRASPQTASQPTVVIRNGGGGRYTLVRVLQHTQHWH
jgi:hypothetical protein